MLRLDFTDLAGKSYALHVRRGVAEFVDNPEGYARKPDYIVRLDRETWAQPVPRRDRHRAGPRLGPARLQGDAKGVERFFALFDRFDPARTC
jgi:hypothetical protein